MDKLTLRDMIRSARGAKRPGAAVSKTKVPRSKSRFHHSSFGAGPIPMQFRWADAISKSEWAIYRAAIKTVRDLNVPFLLGGGFALATYTGHWRDTKDIDFYVRPEDRAAVIAALTRAGFEDYYSRLSYDRNWIYRSVHSDVIVDIIWSMANQRAQVDDLWFKNARSVSVRGEKLMVVPREEFIWCKLYIMQRDHCDWTDIFNLLCCSGTQIDWNHLMARLNEDTSLLKGALSVYGWLCPGYARRLPAILWRKLGLPIPPPGGPSLRHDRVRYLDSRAWFAALQPKNSKLEV